MIELALIWSEVIPFMRETGGTVRTRPSLGDCTLVFSVGLGGGWLGCGHYKKPSFEALRGIRGTLRGCGLVANVEWWEGFTGWECYKEPIAL